MAKALQDAGAKDFELITYPNANHSIWGDVYARKDLFTWMLAQRLSDRLPASNGNQNEETTASPVTDTTTAVPETTEAPADETTAAPSDTASASGCSSSLGVLPVALIGTTALVVRKKKKK